MCLLIFFYATFLGDHNEYQSIRKNELHGHGTRCKFISLITA